MFNPESKFSYFRPPISPVRDESGKVVKYANQKPNGSLTIEQVYNWIRGEGSRNTLPKLTSTLRDISDPDEKKAHDLRSLFKQENLPFVTFGGVFSYRKIDRLTSPSGFVVLDFDHIGTGDKLEAMKQTLSEDSVLDPVLLFVSPSGDGLKIIVSPRQEIKGDREFKQAFFSLENYVKQKYSLTPDPSGKDISRTCFLCYDPQAVLRTPTGQGFDVEKWVPAPEAPKPPVSQAPVRYQDRSGSGTPSTYERVEIAVEDIEMSGIPVADDREMWLKFGFAISEDLGEQGRELYHRIARCSSKYDPQGTDEHFDRSLNSSYTGPRVHIESLFKICSDMGVKFRSSNVRQRESLRTSSRGTEEPQIPVRETPQEETQGPQPTTRRGPSQEDLNRLLTPTTEAEVKQRESSLPEALPTGYQVKSEQGFRQKLLLLSGKLTTIAGATGHGKTLLLMNLLLNVSRLRPDKRFVLFTYEENEDTIIEYLLNIYLNDLNLMRSGDWRSNRILIKEYFSGQGTGNFGKDSVVPFELRKNLFFRKYIETGRILIKYIDSDSTELCSYIDFLSKPENNIGGVFVDYFQCINPDPHKKYPTRQEALKSICFELKDVANKTGLPVVLGCQFNQTVLSPTDVLLTNIGEAGDISRIVSECWGLWQMGKDIGRKVETREQARIESLELKSGQISLRDPFLKGMYLRVLKSRIVETGSEEMFDFRGLTGKIYPNDPDEEGKRLSVPDWDDKGEQGKISFSQQETSSPETPQDDDDLPF